MTGTTRTSHGLDPQRRRALFRAWHRGIRETDLLLGRFADVYIADLTDADLRDFEALMDAPDRDILAWLTGELPVTADYATPVYRALERFHATRDDDEE